MQGENSNINTSKRVSATDITSWQFCPRIFYYQNIEVRPRRITEKMVKGRLLHNVYSYFFRNKLHSDSKYYNWFLTQGVDKLLEAEAANINKLSMNVESLRHELKNHTEKISQSLQAGLLKLPEAVEHTFENEQFKARVDALFSDNVIADIKQNLKYLDNVKLQLAVAALVLESRGIHVEKGIVINAGQWQEYEILIEEKHKQRAKEIREEILKIRNSKQKPELKPVPYCVQCEFNPLCYPKEQIKN